MKKAISSLMLVMTLGTACGPLVTNTTLLASEIKSSELSEPQTEAAVISSDLNSEVSESMSTETSSVESEVTETETISESDSQEVVSAQSIEVSETAESEAVASEETSEVSETVASEGTSEASEITSEDADAEIEAELTIDEDGAVPLTRSYSPANPQADRGEENLSVAEDDARLEANAGESTIEVTPTKKTRSSVDLTDREVYYTLSDDGKLSSGSLKQPRKYEGNLLTVYNNQIVDSDKAIARTSGGYDFTFYMYPSIEDLKDNKNGVSMSGGGFDATFVESVKQDDQYYYHIKISGYDGYVSANDMQIVPEELEKARSYYTVEDGSWTYYSAIDPLTSTKYDRMELGQAPSGATAGTKYYSDDDTNYTTDSIITDGSSTRISYNSYFQNLPFRSESNYTAADFKNYLHAQGKTGSEYYNETSAFTNAQSKENINALMIFSMANHESAYGLSSYAKACYNFFGRGAIDSDPDQACQYYSYPTATDGILAQSLFLENGYFDVLDWRYSGTHVGNKASGMNVKYASDPDWGKKISNHAYMMDQYGKKHNENKYPILQVKGVKHVYTSSGLSTKVKSKGDSGSYNYYDLSQMAGTSNTVNVIAKSQTSSAYKIQVPTAVKQSSNSVCSYTNSKKGSYPNYGGRSKVSVGVGYANFSCDYESYGAQQYWISKANTTKIDGPSIPATTHYKYTYKNGKLYTRYTLDSSNHVLEAVRYNSHEQAETRYQYYGKPKYGQQGNNVKSRIDLYPSTGYVRRATAYDTNHRVTRMYFYQPKTGFSERTKHYKSVYFYKADGKHISKMQQYNTKNQVYRIFRYRDNTTMNNKSGRISNCFYIKPGSGDITTKSYSYNSQGQVVRIYHYLSNTHYSNLAGRTKLLFYIHPSFMISSAVRYDGGHAITKYYYDAGTSYHDDYTKHVRRKVQL